MSAAGIPRSQALATAALSLALAFGVAPVALANTDPSDVEDEVICIQCKRPLSTSSGEAADDQRAFIQRLADDGLTKDEIKQRLVEEYGERVLVDDGSPIAAAAPWIAGLGGIAAVTFALMQRGRRDEGGDGDAPGSTVPGATPPPPSAGDQARIDAELAALED